VFILIKVKVNLFLCQSRTPWNCTGSLDIQGCIKIFWNDTVKIINLTTKCMWKLPTSTQLRVTWHTDSLDMVVLQSTGASRYHNRCRWRHQSGIFWIHPHKLSYILTSALSASVMSFHAVPVVFAG
jgi:hypothetical protein